MTFKCSYDDYAIVVTAITNIQGFCHRHQSCDVCPLNAFCNNTRKLNHDDLNTPISLYLHELLKMIDRGECLDVGGEE